MIQRIQTDYIQDIVTSIEDIEEFIKDMSYAEFTEDRKTAKAVVRSFEVMAKQ